MTLCLDETKEYHPKPLAIAIKAWEYFYIEGNINKDKEENEKQDGHAEQFKNYINSSYAKSDDGCYELLTTNMINHIAAVAHKDPRSKRKPKKIIKN